jgi:hypothetical protein
MFNWFLSLFVSVEVSDAYVNVLSIIVFFSINFSTINLTGIWYAEGIVIVSHVNIIVYFGESIIKVHFDVIFYWYIC